MIRRSILLDVFAHSEFGFVMLALIIMFFFVYIGNPHINNSILCWHHIPEMFGFFFIGAWLSKIRCPKIGIGGLYIGIVLLQPIISGVLSFGIHIFSFVVTFLALLCLPLLLGFIVRKRMK